MTTTRDARFGRYSRCALIGSAGALLASIAFSGSRAQALDPVLDRQLVMQQLEKDADGLGNVLAGLEPVEKLPVYAKAIAKGAAEARESFLSKTPGGSTRPEAWSNWADFSQRMDSFAAKSAEMAKISESGTIGAVNAIVGDALPCKACHDLYRVKKKPAAPPAK